MKRLHRICTAIAVITVLAAFLGGCRWPTASQVRMLNQGQSLPADLSWATRVELPNLTPQQREWVDFTAEEVSCAVTMHVITEEDDPTKTLNSLRQAYTYEAAAKQGIKLAVLGKAYLRINDFQSWMKAYAEADSEQQQQLAEQVFRRCILGIKP